MAKMTPITMPAMAPGERADEDLEAPGLADSDWGVEVAAAVLREQVIARNRGDVETLT